VRSGYLFSPLWKGLAQRGGIEGVLSLKLKSDLRITPKEILFMPEASKSRAIFLKWVWDEFEIEYCE
jgi:hypothetical protein